MISPSPAAIEAAAKFYEFLGQHGVAKTIRERKGFRTTAEVFAQFENEVTSPLLDRISELEQERFMLVRGELPAVTMIPRDDDGITYIMFTTEEEIIPIGFDDSMLDELRALFGQPKLTDLETVIADTMASGNDITAFEIAEAVRDMLTNLVKD